MNIRTFLSTWHGTKLENRTHRWFGAVMLATNVVLALALLMRDHTVVMVPPTLGERAEVSESAASDTVISSWGLHVAILLGNVTPSTSGFIKDAIAPILRPPIYQRVLDAIAAQVKQIQDEQVTLSFHTTETRLDAERGTVYVTGELVTRGVRGTETRETRTYELTFVVHNYRVLLDDVRVYAGRPKADA